MLKVVVPFRDFLVFQWKDLSIINLLMKGAVVVPFRDFLVFQFNISLSSKKLIFFIQSQSLSGISQYFNGNNFRRWHCTSSESQSLSGISQYFNRLKARKTVQHGLMSQSLSGISQYFNHNGFRIYTAPTKKSQSLSGISQYFNINGMLAGELEVIAGCRSPFQGFLSISIEGVESFQKCGEGEVVVPFKDFLVFQ